MVYGLHVLIILEKNFFVQTKPVQNTVDFIANMYMISFFTSSRIIRII